GAPSVAANDARELADPDDFVRGQISHVRASYDGRHVMLAVRFELGVAQHDHLIIASDFLEGSPQVIGWVAQVSREPIAICAHDALGRVPEPLPFGILAGPA